MKKIFILLLALSISTKHLQSQESDPVEYMEDLFETANNFKTETWQYLKALTSGKSPKQIEKKRQALIKEIKNSKNTINAKKAYKSDDKLKLALLAYLDLSYKVIKEDYDEILDMEAIADQSYDFMEAYILAQEKANEKLRHAFDGVVNAQKEFAKENNITLIENTESDETDLKIEKAQKTLKYYNTIYLIFFKSYKQEIYFLDAQAKGDLSGMEQNLSALESFNSEGIEKLKEIESYNGDSELKNIANKMLKFYTDEAKKSFPDIISFYIAKDKFEKIKTQFDAKKTKTQEDVDKYNKALENFNSGIDQFNNTINNTNSERTNLLNLWNSKIAEFLEKHSN